VDNRGVDWLSPFLIAFVGFGALATIVELIRPARKLRYRKALPRDLVALAVYQLGVVSAATWVCAPGVDFMRHHLSAAVAELPLAPRVLAFYLVADLGSYWMHRLMHTRAVWRVHRWHHSPEQLYWLAGVRASIPQQILFNLPAIAAIPILAGAPAWVITAMLIEGVVRNDWMHMNVTWRSRWLEYVLVTPRYHHIHHSTDAELHDANYGSLFSIWDRLFGTYEPERERVRYGLTTNINTFNPVRVAFHEYIALWRDIRRAPTWRERAGHAGHGPGWKPVEEEA
jgi:sterol desaturase/sphingolipid hydroxylase (fatty acid hydroxylase superfamily)